MNKPNARHQAAVAVAVKRLRRRWIACAVVAGISVPVWLTAGHPLLAVSTGCLCVMFAATARGQR